MTKPTLMKIQNLTVSLRDQSQCILNQISLEVPVASIVGLAGGSGSGKTTLGLMMMNLMSPAMKKTSGEIYFEQKNILSFSPKDLRSLRGRKIAMVFQEPWSSFNPLYTVGQQIMETLITHKMTAGVEAKLRALMWLQKCGVDDVERVFLSYPHELSGGLRQRAMIAQAICCEPCLLIADEPTSNLDVQTQNVILELFKMLRLDLNIAMVLISHDLHILRRIADEVVVMHQGEIVEKIKSSVMREQAQHPYTQALLKAELM